MQVTTNSWRPAAHTVVPPEGAFTGLLQSHKEAIVEFSCRGNAQFPRQ